MTDAFNLLHAWAWSESWRVITTLTTLAACWLGAKLWARLLERSAAGHRADIKRSRLVWSKNVTWTLGVVAILAIWGSKIAGFALSLAAFAGAMLIVSKELITCVLGYVTLTLSRSYRVGQFIELGGYSGRVVDIDLFYTTLAETGTARQLTGKTVSFPNSFVLTSSLRNNSATGEYQVSLYKLVLPYNCDMPLAEKCAIAAAEAATAAWRKEADEHLERLEASNYIDLPSSKPKVLWEPLDYRSHGLTIRFACPMEERVTTEQDVFRRFWAAYSRAADNPAPEEKDA